MTAMAHEPHESLTQADVLLEGFLALDTPEGFRAELTEGEIVVTPPGIPLYLLVDRDTSAVTLFSEPEGRDYLQSRTAPFGKSLTLPEPFGFDLDTAELL